MTRFALARLVLGLTAGLAALAPASSRADTVRGMITYAGAASAPRKLSITTDKAVCANKISYDQTLLVGAKKGLANAVIAIDGIKAAAPKPASVTVDQIGCVYTPHVAAATVGSKLKLANSDATLHNVHAYVDSDTVFNLALPQKGLSTVRNLDEAGVVTLKCDVHAWMSAYVLVFEHPFFAVTDKNGAFTIAGVPPGAYQVTVWHEKLGTKTGQVNVGKSGAATPFALSY